MVCGCLLVVLFKLAVGFNGEVTTLNAARRELFDASAACLAASFFPS